jgi:S-adenosyl-L-methionine hydrolase (adenosine-forming)
MKTPVISLLTDFGLRDHYVAAMKGVILGICPNARLVDITHETSAYEIAEAAYALAQAAPCFPAGTVHLVVVDPGVGSSRRPLLAEAAGQRFVAPDNGVLTMVLNDDPKHRVREITAEPYFRKPVSRTFHGRDIFAPVAAHLAFGVPPAKFGRKIDDFLRLNLAQPQRAGRRGWSGSILKIDRFGNIITNFEWRLFSRYLRQPFEIYIGLRAISRLAGNYSDIAGGEICAIEGSSGYIEISAHEASAANILGVSAGMPAEMKLGTS